jgi:pyruvate-formate lyase-activating enzyme
MLLLFSLVIFLVLLYSFAYVGTNMDCKYCHLFKGEHVHFTPRMVHSPNYASDHEMCTLCETYPGEKHFHAFNL